MIDLKNYQTEWVEISKIDTENTQFKFRQSIDVTHLAQSFREEGQKFPIILWHRHTGKLQIISGFRRLAAAKSFNWDKILGIIIPETDLSENDALRLNFIENIERKSLNDMDLMFACKKLSEEKKSNVEIAKLISKDEAMVRRYLKVANAPAEIQDAVKHGKISVKKLNLILGKDKPRTGSEAQTDKQTTQELKKTPEEELRKALLSKDYMTNIQQMVNNMQGIVSEISGIPGFGKEVLKKIQEEEKLAAKESDLPNIDTIKSSTVLASERMYVKPIAGGGFDIVLKYRPKTDNIKKAIEFLERNVLKLKQIVKEKQEEAGMDSDWW